MNSYTAAESEMSLESRSFLHRVNDQVRKKQNQSSKAATKDSDKHSVIWGMCMSSALQASVFMEKNCSDNWHSIKNTGRNLTMEQMFDIFEKLIAEQPDEIYGVKTVNWEHSSWKYLSLVGGEEVISLSHTKVYFQIRYYALEGWTRTPNQLMHGKTDWRGSKVHQNTELWTELMVSQWNSSGTSSRDSPHCSLSVKSKSSCQKWAYNQKISKDGSSSCRCSTTSHGDLLKKNRNAN